MLVDLGWRVDGLFRGRIADEGTGLFVEGLSGQDNECSQSILERACTSF